MNIQLLNLMCSEQKLEWSEGHEKELKVLTWPSNFQDPNPIEHPWDVVDKQVQTIDAPPRNKQCGVKNTYLVV